MDVQLSASTGFSASRLVIEDRIVRSLHAWPIAWAGMASSSVVTAKDGRLHFRPRNLTLTRRSMIPGSSCAALNIEQKAVWISKPQGI